MFVNFDGAVLQLFCFSRCVLQGDHVAARWHGFNIEGEWVRVVLHGDLGPHESKWDAAF